MYDPNLDAECARLLDWEIERIGESWFRVWKSGEAPGSPYVWQGKEYTHIPQFSCDASQTPYLWKKIEMNGREESYLDILVDILFPARHRSALLNAHDIWKLISASPEQYARAFVMTMGVGVLT
jgi:hypothetical protein